MPALGDSEIRSMCGGDPPLVSNFLSLDEQIQPAGFDLSLARVYSLEGQGTLRSRGEPNLVPRKQEVKSEGNIYRLEPGYYLALFNEVISLPKNIVGIGKPRSTLIRYGAHINAGIWDPGFQGKSQCGIAVFNPNGISIEQSSTLVQVVFFQLRSSSAGFDYNHLYKDSAGDFKVL